MIGAAVDLIGAKCRTSDGDRRTTPTHCIGGGEVDPHGEADVMIAPVSEAVVSALGLGGSAPRARFPRA